MDRVGSVIELPARLSFRIRLGGAIVLCGVMTIDGTECSPIPEDDAATVDYLRCNP